MREHEAEWVREAVAKTVSGPRTKLGDREHGREREGRADGKREGAGADEGVSELEGEELNRETSCRTRGLEST